MTNSILFFFRLNIDLWDQDFGEDARLILTVVEMVGDQRGLGTSVKVSTGASDLFLFHMDPYQNVLQTERKRKKGKNLEKG